MSEEVKKEGSQASENQEEVQKKDAQASESQEIDYKAELARVTAERDNYKTGMLNAKDQLKKKVIKKEEFEEEESVIDQSELIAKAVQEAIKPIQQSLEQSTFEQIVREYASDPSEIALIKFHLENSVGPTGSLRDRIENAKLIANKKTIFKENSEMKRALESRAGIGSPSFAAGGNVEAEKSGGKEFFSPEQIAELKKRGLDPKEVEKIYRENQSKAR